MRVEDEDHEIPFRKMGIHWRDFSGQQNVLLVFQKDHYVGCVENKPEMTASNSGIGIYKLDSVKPRSCQFVPHSAHSHL